ncbi:MAG: ParB/RepB/Spo0J family partition protein [Oscillospiraceae bacterium]|nr:ParB/RepB/Spo0J family partition protein [Oscillospiraceae bacterium]
MKKSLGRGYDSLFSPTSQGIGDLLSENETAVKMKISQIEPDPDQPRKLFEQEQLQELADSIAEHGVIQPIIVVSGENGYYRIIAGERRWRAAKIAGLSEIPVIVRDYSDAQAAEISLIENLQREDLNPIEEAMGYKSLIDRFGLTQDKISERVGKSRSNVANMLRLLNLDPELQAYVRGGKLSTGHARALLAITDREKRLETAGRIINEGLTVRQVEELTKSAPKPEKKAVARKKQSEYPDIEKDLSEKFGTKVKIKGGSKGKIELEFYSMEDLIRIIDILNIK